MAGLYVWNELYSIRRRWPWRYGRWPADRHQRNSSLRSRPYCPGRPHRGSSHVPSGSWRWSHKRRALVAQVLVADAILHDVPGQELSVADLAMHGADRAGAERAAIDQQDAPMACGVKKPGRRQSSARVTMAETVFCLPMEAPKPVSMPQMASNTTRATRRKRFRSLLKSAEFDFFSERPLEMMDVTATALHERTPPSR